MKSQNLGTGWQFPPLFDKKEGHWAMISDKENIRQGLAILFSTKPGERLIFETFGCDMRRYAFESINSYLVNNIRQQISAAIIRFEPRIKLNNLQVRPVENLHGQRLDIRIEYTIKESNQIDETMLSIAIEH